MFYIFTSCVLKKNSRYYIGSCQNISERLIRHNKGYVRSTRFGGPWKIIYQETFSTLQEAIRRERQLKSWKKRENIERLIKQSK
jgi:putative endonuclease